MTIRIAPRARRDLAARVAYIARDNPRAAERFAVRVFEVIDELAEHLMDGPEQVLTSGEVVRSWPVQPVRIYYQRGDDELTVLRIYHQARLPLTR